LAKGGILKFHIGDTVKVDVQTASFLRNKEGVVVDFDDVQPSSVFLVRFRREDVHLASLDY
jgi:hypothetical protein